MFDANDNSNQVCRSYLIPSSALEFFLVLTVDKQPNVPSQVSSSELSVSERSVTKLILIYWVSILLI